MVEKFIIDFDYNIYQYILLNLNAPWISLLCKTISNEKIVLLPIIYFIIKYRKSPYQIFLILISALIALAVSESIASGLKEIIQRPRPAEIFLIYRNPGVYSFPSAHALNSMTQAIIWGYWFNKYRILFICSSFAIGASRVIGGYHFLSDVCAGLLFGGITGYLLLLLFKNTFYPDIKTNIPHKIL